MTPIGSVSLENSGRYSWETGSAQKKENNVGTVSRGKRGKDSKTFPHALCQGRLTNKAHRMCFILPKAVPVFSCLVLAATLQVGKGQA